MDSSTRLPGQYAAPNTQSLFLMLVNLKIYQQKWHKYSSDFLGGGFFFFFVRHLAPCGVFPRTQSPSHHTGVPRFFLCLTASRPLTNSQESLKKFPVFVKFSSAGLPAQTHRREKLTPLCDVQLWGLPERDNYLRAGRTPSMRDRSSAKF